MGKMVLNRPSMSQYVEIGLQFGIVFLENKAYGNYSTWRNAKQVLLAPKRII